MGFDHIPSTSSPPDLQFVVCLLTEGIVVVQDDNTFEEFTF